MTGICAGYRSFTSKTTGGMCVVYSFIVPFSAQEVSQGAVGMKVQEYFTNRLFAVEPNGHYELFFEPGYNGRAQLVDIKPSK